jgi:hypothetical protein
MTDDDRRQQQRARAELARQQLAVQVLRARGWRVTEPTSGPARQAQAALVLKARGYTVTPPRRWR